MWGVDTSSGERERERERLIELLLLTRRPSAGHSRRHYDSSHPTYQNLVILFPLLTPSFPPLLLLLPLLFSTLSALFSPMLPQGRIHATGLVNCLIVSECSQNVPFRGRKLKFGGSNSDRPLPTVEWDTNHSKMLDPPLRATSFRCGAQPTQHGVDNSWIIIDVVLSSSSESTAAAAASAPLCYTPLNDQW